MATVWIYIDRRNEDKPVVFATADDARAWFKEHDPEGVAWEYPVISSKDDPEPPRPVLNNRA